MDKDNELIKKDSLKTFDNAKTLDSTSIEIENSNLEMLKTMNQQEGEKKEMNFLYWLLIPLILMSISAFQKQWGKPKIEKSKI